jgi:hypothetical protein
VRLQYIGWLHFSDWIVLGQIVRDRIPYDLPTPLQNSLGDIQSSSALDLLHRCTKLRGRNLVYRTRANRGEDIDLQAFDHIVGMPRIAPDLPVSKPLSGHGLERGAARMFFGRWIDAIRELGARFSWRTLALASETAGYTPSARVFCFPLNR